MDASSLDGLRASLQSAAMLLRSDPDAFARTFNQDVPFAAHCGMEQTIRDLAANVIQRFPENADRVEPLHSLLGTHVSENDLHDSIHAIDLFATVQMVIDAQPNGAGYLPNDREQAVIDVIRKAGKRMTGKEVASALAPLYSNAPAISETLGVLVRAQILDNASDSRGRGYGLKEWKKI